jgi:DNA primase large subunit
MSAYSQDICATGRSGGLQLPGIGITGGSTTRDMNCERMKLSKLLNDYGMKVAAVAILCQDERVFEAMEQAGTPCPFEGKIGGAAVKQWKKYDIERPDYEKYVEKIDERLKIDERIAKDEGTLEENASLKTDIEDVAKQNNALQNDIAKLKEVQAELIAAQKAEIERLQGIVEEEAEADRILREAAELITEEERAAKWADDELDRKERIQEMVIEVTELDKNATIELQEDGRVKLLLPVNQR